MSGCFSKKTSNAQQENFEKTPRDAKEMKTLNSRSIAGHLAPTRYAAWIPTLGLGPERGGES